jgi:7-cyano-7-deazaguanine synthase
LHARGPRADRRFVMSASSINPSSSALVLFSGGQDSATCLAWALGRFARVETVGFDYGQRHAVEMQARLRVRDGMARVLPGVADRLGPDHVVDITGFGRIADSALTSDRAIEMDARGLPTTFVPGRNLVFLTYAAALADRRGLEVLVGGMCETDYSGYPDCRRETMDAMQQALSLGLDKPVSIETPLMQLTKAETWALAHDLGGDALVQLIIEDSHTCYLGDRDHRHPWGYGCGTCPACELRAAGYDQWAAGA